MTERVRSGSTRLNGIRVGLVEFSSKRGRVNSGPQCRSAVARRRGPPLVEQEESLHGTDLLGHEKASLLVVLDALGHDLQFQHLAQLDERMDYGGGAQ